MNEPEAITGALYGNPRSNSANKLVIFVWYSWFYARCLKTHILCKPTTMPEMSGRTHQTCNLHIIAIWNETLLINQTFHHPLKDIAGKPSMGPCSRCSLRGMFCRQDCWCFWRGWIRCQFLWRKWYECWFVFCPGSWFISIVLMKVITLS